MYLTVEKLKEDVKKDVDILCYISDRGGRKSSVCQDFLIEDAINGHPFVLLRSKSDITISENWLSSYIVEKYKNFSFFSVDLRRDLKAIYFKDENDNVYLLCFGMFLSLADKYKSNYFEGFEKVRYILWEEAIPNKKIIQRVNKIRESKMQDLFDVMSIKSTVCRERESKVIMLGNDISFNVLNPITIEFNLLERLSKDCEITDSCIIDDKQYNFYFNYFSFPNSEEHWLNNKDLDISIQDVPKDAEKLPFLIYTDFKKYYIYTIKNYLFITNKQNSKSIHFFQNEQEFFENYGALHLFKKFDLQIALHILTDLYHVSNSDIVEYFGTKWFFEPPVFKIPEKQTTANNIINVSELCKMNYSEILNSDQCSNILAFRRLLIENKVIYCNYKLKYEIEKLLDILFFVEN